VRCSAALATVGELDAAIAGALLAARSTTIHRQGAVVLWSIVIYGASVAAVIDKLNAFRSSLGAQLSHAQDAGDRARAETAIAAAHITAASTLLPLNAGPASGANSALVSALQMTARAYEALAQATARADTSTYSAATASLTRATTALASAYGQLQRLGYRVG